MVEVDPEDINCKKHSIFWKTTAKYFTTSQEPIEYFRDIRTDEFLFKMVEESNKYALQIDITKPLNLLKAELEQFIGILFLMLTVKMPSTQEYREQSLRYKTISKVMPIKHFEQIKRFLHCNDNPHKKANRDLTEN